MKIWLVEGDCGVYGSVFLGVYNTEQKAINKQEAEEKENKETNTYKSIEVYEMEVE